MGQSWYEQIGQHQLIPEVVERLAQHVNRGESVAFVSGSWLPCLLPIARDLGAEYLFCSDVEVINGRLTGYTLTVMVGETKAATVKTFAARHDLDLARCFAYGDDSTDSPMLALVGHPVAVRPSPELSATAHQNGWEVLLPPEPVLDSK